MNHERERFSATEVAVVLSHFDLGPILAAYEFPRGSRRSPKLILRTAKGGYLLKRRATGRDDPQRVAFAHALLNHLRAKRFSVPAVMPTRDGGDTMVLYNDRTYEMFEFVRGDAFDGSLEAATHAGRTLGRYHAAVRDFSEEWIGLGTFHDSQGVRNGLNSIPTTTAGHDSVIGREAEMLAMVQALHEQYDEAAAAAREAGIGEAPRSVIHCDWHPGNMLFRGARVAVVLDFDSARTAERAIDVANGMLQFSIIRGSGDPAQWPAFFDEARMRRFFIGYASKVKLAASELVPIPHLMIESLIAESVVPIAATGSLGPLPGFTVLQMVRRKVQWLLGATPQIRTWLLE